MTPTRIPAALRVLKTRGNRSGKPRADQASAVYCTRTHAPRQPFARRRSPLAARLHPFWGHATRSMVSSKSSAANASPRYRQYSSTASVGASGRPRSAMTRCPLISNCSFFDQVASDHQRVHAGAETCADCVGRRVYDGFAAQIKRRVQNHGHARPLSEFIDQPPIKRIGLFLDGLRPRAAVHMRDRWNYAAFFWTHLRRQYHKRRIRRALQVFACGFLLERRRKWPPPLPEFHRIVDLGVHFRIARIGKNRAASERARAKFHTPLKPAENFSQRKQVRRA